MGMFDCVNFEMNCPVCHELVSGFQSKDGKRVMKELEIGEIANFYSSCTNCKTWIEFNLDKSKITIDDYIMTFEPKEYKNYNKTKKKL